MPSAKQIKARKEFAKRVKRGDFRKAKKSKLHLTKGDTVSHQMIKGKMWTSVTSKGAKSNPHGKTNFTLADYEKNEDINYHAENALELVKKYGTKAEIKKIEAINKRHHARGHLLHEEGILRLKISDKYYDRLVADSKK